MPAMEVVALSRPGVAHTCASARPQSASKVTASRGDANNESDFFKDTGLPFFSQI